MGRRIAVVRLRGSYRLAAEVLIESGELLFHIEGQVTDKPSIYTLQVGENSHIEVAPSVTLGEIIDHHFWRFMNHNCEPNTTIRSQDVYALCRINPWEEITFNYNSTEAVIAEPFECRCGSRTCYGQVRGFNHLSRAEQEDLRPLLAPHLLARLDGDIGVRAG